MAVNKTEQEALWRLISRIDESPGSGSWKISTEDLAEALGTDLVELYRRIYQNPRSIDFGEAIEGFDQGRVGELIALLEELGYRSAEETFYREGLFVPLQAGSRLTDAVVNRSVRELRQHTVVWEQIAHELERPRSYREAARSYLAEHLPLEAVAEGVVESFLREEELPRRGKETLMGYLRSLAERHVLDYHILGARFFEEVYRFAVARGYIKPREQASYWAEDGERHEKGTRRNRGSGEGERTLSWARSLLGVSPGEGREAIRRAYRKEMLRYHPDVNPSGTEVAKELNAAYATLLADSEDSR